MKAKKKRRPNRVASDDGLERAVLEERETCAKICSLRASKKGTDDEAENEAQLCGALIRERL